MSADPNTAVPRQMAPLSCPGGGCVLGGGDSGFVGAAAIWRGTAVETAGRGRGFWRAVVLPTQSQSRDLGIAISSSSAGAGWSEGWHWLSEGSPLREGGGGGGMDEKQYIHVSYCFAQPNNFYVDKFKLHESRLNDCISFLMFSKNRQQAIVLIVLRLYNQLFNLLPLQFLIYCIARAPKDIINQPMVE